MLCLVLRPDGFQRESFWEEVAESLFRQRALLKLLAGKRRKSRHLSEAASTRLKQRLNDFVRFKALRQLVADHRQHMHLMESLEQELQKSKLNRARSVPGSFIQPTSGVSEEAKMNGNIIFDTLDRDKKGYITIEDLKPFFKHTDRVEHAFKVLQLPVCSVLSSSVRLKERAR